MQGLLMILSGLAWAVDLLLLVLDLNYWLVSSVISFLFWTIHFIFSLPGAISLALLQCWECMWLGMAALGDSCCGLVMGSVQSVGSVLGGALAGLDALQLAWNLLCHVVMRSKEMMQRGLLNIAMSGQNLHRQVWEAVTIGASLATYLVNTLVNLFLIAVQYILSSVLSLWLCVVNVLFMSKEWIVTMFSQLSNTAVTVAILLWAPFKMAADILVSCSTGIGVIIFKHLYEVLLLLFLIWVTRMLFRPSPVARFLQEKLNMFYQTLLVCLHIILSSDVWRRVVERSLQLIRMYGAAWYQSVNGMRTRAPDAPTRTRAPDAPPRTGAQEALPRTRAQEAPPRTRAQEPPPRTRAPDAPPRTRAPDAPPRTGAQEATPRTGAPGEPQRTNRVQEPARPILQPARLNFYIPSRRNSEADRTQAPQQAPPSPQCSASTSRESEPAAEDPWKLLKQQEESRKCVICQDETKSILLLPCRHLCLCGQCAIILLQQPILQRNCPLCRQMILQTLNVYM